MAAVAAADSHSYTQEERNAIRDATVNKIDKLVAEAGPTMVIEAMNEFSDHEETAVQAVCRRLTKMGIGIRITPELSEIIQRAIADVRPRLEEHTATTDPVACGDTPT